MPTTILICGSPGDGFQIVGFFADSGDAECYAEDHSLRDWWIAELTSPEAFAESQRRRFRAARGPSAEPTPKGRGPGSIHQPTASITSISAPGRGRRAGRRKKPQPSTAGASWQSGSKLEFGPSRSASRRAERFLVAFPRSLGLVHPRQRFAPLKPSEP